jgi:hypothetical protein
MRTLRGLDAPALSAVEQDRLREAADALLFARDLDDGDVQWALAEVAVLADELIDAERWTPRRARQLLDDIWACGRTPRRTSRLPPDHALPCATTCTTALPGMTLRRRC